MGKGRRKRGEREERQPHIDVSLMPLTGDLACNLGMCPRLGIKTGTLWFAGWHPTTELHQPGHIFSVLLLIWSFFCYCINIFNSTVTFFFSIFSTYSVFCWYFYFIIENFYFSIFYLLSRFVFAYWNICMMTISSNFPFLSFKWNFSCFWYDTDFQLEFGCF